MAIETYDPEVRLDPRSNVAQFLLALTETKFRVLDAAAGNGCDSIMLFRHGHLVTANEINDQQVSELKANADEHAALLDTVSYRWEAMGELLPAESYDAILVSRNAFAMAEPSERVVALESFKRLLAINGILIIDETNVSEKQDEGTLNSRAFAPGELVSMLKSSGFTKVDAYGDLEPTDSPDLVDSSVLTYVARR